MYNNFSFAHKTELVKYKNKYIQTYSFGDGDNVVLSLPSFPHSGLTYLLFLRHKKHVNAKFITFDLPGWIGYSENTFDDDKFSFTEIVNIVDSILNHYKVDRFNVIGYSFGGALALQVVQRFHNRVNRIVLVSTIVNANLIKNLMIVRKIKIAHYFKLAKAIRNVINKSALDFFKYFRAEGIPENLLDEYRGMLGRLNNKILLDSAYKLFTSDFTDELNEVMDKEFMIINSKEEGLMFKIQATYIRRLLKTEKSIYLHGTHDDFIFKPDSEVVNKVIEFLGSQDNKISSTEVIL